MSWSTWAFSAVVPCKPQWSCSWIWQPTPDLSRRAYIWLLLNDKIEIHSQPNQLQGSIAACYLSVAMRQCCNTDPSLWLNPKAPTLSRAMRFPSYNGCTAVLADIQHSAMQGCLTVELQLDSVLRWTVYRVLNMLLRQLILYKKGRMPLQKFL